jgi:hypothetical protein
MSTFLWIVAFVLAALAGDTCGSYKQDQRDGWVYFFMWLVLTGLSLGAAHFT